MKKFNVAALLIGLSLALVTTSAFRTTDDSLYGFDSTESEWISISDYDEGDPNDLNPGEYGCELAPTQDCTALLDGPEDESPSNVRKGNFVYEVAP